MNIRKLAVDMLPPVTLAVVLCFWGLAPKALVESTWTAIAMTVLVTSWVLGLEFLFERHQGWRMNRREFFTDLFYMVMNVTLISKVAQLVGDEPLMAFKTAAGIATPWAAQMPFLAQVALVVFVYEFGQYWMHRLMHNSTPFWMTHAPHHHITQLNAMKGAVGNPIELVLVSLSIIVLFDVSQTAVMAGFSATSVISTFAHANVRSDPPKFYSFFFTTIRNHSLHHSVPYEDTRCNYGNSLILLDRIFGTYKEGEASIVGQDERRRLSIREQFVFPFVPLLNAWRARKSGIVTEG